MIIISLTDCPPAVKGGLSRWLFEINTGVYAGNVSARVRDALWKDICQHLRDGRATMVYPADNEQGFTYRVYNTTWEPVDFDGITLMRRPTIRSLQERSQEIHQKLSDVEKQRIVRRRQAVEFRRSTLDEYCVIDLETTGLNVNEDRIIDIGVIRVSMDEICDRFSRLIRIDRPIPVKIADLTGLNNEMLAMDGEPLETALPATLEFIGDAPLIGYNVMFDIAFLRAACRRLDLAFPHVRATDVLDLARRKIFDLPSFKLERLAEHFQLDVLQVHRAMNDCLLTWHIYRKLTESK